MDEKRAIIDIGSNTVRLVVYNGPARAPIVLLNEKVTPRLGKDVAADGKLSEEAMAIALDALARYAQLLRMLEVDNIQTVATAAVRDADNRDAFVMQIAKLGLETKVLSGKEEARTSAMGVIGAFPGAKGTAGDLGGGSLELTRIADGSCIKGVTLPLGTLRLPPLREGGDRKFGSRVGKMLGEAGWKGGGGKPFYIVGGSWRALALYAMHETGYPLDDPHDFELSPEESARICDALAAGTVNEDVSRISSSRMATLPDAAALLGTLTRLIEPSRIVFSSWGLREGLVFSGHDAAIRAQDPMLAGVENFARSYAVCPDQSRAVDAWIGKLFTDCSKQDRDLRLAATTLAMATMRGEPNMRAGQAMNWALRKRWIGLDARGRAMIAMAVRANSNLTDTPDELAGLASSDDLKMAAAWGLAIRLCRKLTYCAAEAIAGTRLNRDGKRLVLAFDDNVSQLESASVTKNLRRLADWLALEWDLHIEEQAAS